MGKKEVQNNSSLVGIGWIVLLVFVASVLVSGFDTGFTGITGYATADVVECKTEGVNLDSSKTISGVRIMKPTFDGGSVTLNVGGTQYTNVRNGKVIELNSDYQTDGLKKITVRELNRPVVELEVYLCKTKPQREPKVAKGKAPKIKKNDVLNLKVVLDTYGGQNTKIIDKAIKSYQKSQKKIASQIKRSEKLETNYKTRAGKVGSSHRKYSAFKNLEVKYKDLAVSQRLKNDDYDTIIMSLGLLKQSQKPDEIISNLRADGKFVPGEPRNQPIDAVNVETCTDDDNGNNDPLVKGRLMLNDKEYFDYCDQGISYELGCRKDLTPSIIDAAGNVLTSGYYTTGIICGSGKACNDGACVVLPPKETHPLALEFDCNTGDFFDTYCGLENTRKTLDYKSETAGFSSFVALRDELRDNEGIRSRPLVRVALEYSAASFIPAHVNYDQFCLKEVGQDDKYNLELKDGKYYVNVCQKCGVPRCNPQTISQPGTIGDERSTSAVASDSFLYTVYSEEVESLSGKTCTDFEVGVDPLLKGVIYYQSQNDVEDSYDDSCVNLDNVNQPQGVYLSERYCDGNLVKSQILQCRYGCYNGACKRA